MNDVFDAQIHVPDIKDLAQVEHVLRVISIFYFLLVVFAVFRDRSSVYRTSTKTNRAKFVNGHKETNNDN